MLGVGRVRRVRSWAVVALLASSSLASWVFMRSQVFAEDEKLVAGPIVETPSKLPLPAPPVVPSLTPADLSSDPLFQEFRKLVKDPKSEFYVPPISIGTASVGTVPKLTGQESLKVHCQERERRLKSIEKLIAASLALVEEAANSSDAEAEEAQELLEAADQLTAMISKLTSRAAPKTTGEKNENGGR